MNLATISAGESAAAAAWATFAVLLITAAFARSQVREAARLRREQTRPFVIVQYEFRSVLIQIAVRNVGKTVARNVKIEFDQPLQSRQFGDKKFADMALFTEGLPNLAPGQVIRVHFDHFPNRVEAALPMRYTARVSYDDHDGRRLPVDEFILDLSPYVQAAREPKGIHDLVEAVEHIGRELAKWTDGSRGLLVNTIDRSRERRLDDRPYQLNEFTRLRANEGWRSALRHVVRDWRRRHGWYAE